MILPDICYSFNYPLCNSKKNHALIKISNCYMVTDWDFPLTAVSNIPSGKQYIWKNPNFETKNFLTENSTFPTLLTSNEDVKMTTFQNSHFKDFK